MCYQELVSQMLGCDKRQIKLTSWYGLITHRRVHLVIGHSSQNYSQRVLHKWSQAEKTFQIIPNAAKDAAVMFHRPTIQEARLII